MKYSVLLFFLGGVLLSAQAQEDTTVAEMDSLDIVNLLDSLDAQFDYQTGNVTIQEGIVGLEVPEGFKFLDAEQSAYVLHELWGNPPSLETQGMLFPDVYSPHNGWAFNITYDPIGYVEDKDAEDIDYDELLSSMQEEFEAINPQRQAQGYGAMYLIGWAAPPYYDSEKKTLHWAKELKFEGEESNTLNYDVRVLGRKGILSMNAIAGLEDLEEVNSVLDVVVASAAFEEGNTYQDFDPKLDKVAAYGIGGLIAGKVLAKTGFFAIIAKFAKFIFIGIAAGIGILWRFISGRKSEEA